MWALLPSHQVRQVHQDLLLDLPLDHLLGDHLPVSDLIGMDWTTY